MPERVATALTLCRLLWASPLQYKRCVVHHHACMPGVQLPIRGPPLTSPKHPPSASRAPPSAGASHSPIFAVALDESAKIRSLWRSFPFSFLSPTEAR